MSTPLGRIRSDVASMIEDMAADYGIPAAVFDGWYTGPRETDPERFTDRLVSDGWLTPQERYDIKGMFDAMGSSLRLIDNHLSALHIAEVSEVQRRKMI